MKDGYMTLGETLKHDFQCIFEFAFDTVSFVVSFIFKVLWIVVKVAFSVLSILLTILAIRDATQWFFGTGKFRND